MCCAILFGCVSNAMVVFLWPSRFTGSFDVSRGKIIRNLFAANRIRAALPPSPDIGKMRVPLRRRK
jgi:hypothetical protein